MKRKEEVKGSSQLREDNGINSIGFPHGWTGLQEGWVGASLSLQAENLPDWQPRDVAMGGAALPQEA